MKNSHYSMIEFIKKKFHSTILHIDHRELGHIDLYWRTTGDYDRKKYISNSVSFKKLDSEFEKQLYHIELIQKEFSSFFS